MRSESADRVVPSSRPGSRAFTWLMAGLLLAGASVNVAQAGAAAAPGKTAEAPAAGAAEAKPTPAAKKPPVRKRAGPPRRGPGGKAGEVEEEKLDSLKDLRDFQKFVYLPGGRDPFTFRVRIEKAKAADRGVGEEGTTTGPIDDTTEEQKVAMLRRKIAAVENLIMRMHDYEAAMKECEEVRKEVTAGDSGSIFTSSPILNQLYRKILSYERTAKRLQQAVEIREEFGKLNVEVKGVLWTPVSALATVNDTVLRSGGQVKDTGAGSPVLVVSIHEDSVVFTYKGQRFRKLVGASGPLESNRETK